MNSNTNFSILEGAVVRNFLVKLYFIFYLTGNSLYKIKKQQVLKLHEFYGLD